MALNHERHALRNIELVNVNAGHMGELDLGQDTLAAVMEQMSLLQAQLASKSQDVLPASANEDGEDAMDLQGGSGHSSEDSMRNWLDISYDLDRSDWLKNSSIGPPDSLSHLHHQLYDDALDLSPWHFPTVIFSRVCFCGNTIAGFLGNESQCSMGQGSGLSPSLFFAKLGLAHLCDPTHRAESGFSSVSLPCNKMPPHEMDYASTGGDKVCK
jgi:hypothetical protein